MEKIPARKLQLGCLTVIGLAMLFNAIFGGMVDGMLKHFVVFYTTAIAMLFVGITICQPMTRRARILFFTGAAFCAWVLLLQLGDFVHFESTAYYGARFVYSAFFCEYLMMLPFAALAEKDGSITGLRILGGICAAIGVVAGLLTVLLICGIVPGFFPDYFGWASNRLGLCSHPNQLARAFLLAMAGCLILLWDSQKRWVQILLALLAAADYIGIALTNSRTALIPACGLICGAVFFLIYTAGTRKGTLSRFLLGLLAAAVVLVACYKLSDQIAQITYDMRDAQVKQEAAVKAEAAAPAEAETKAPAAAEHISPPRELTQDMFTFNGRTDIWAAAIQAVKDHPSVLLTGVKDPGKLITEYHPDGAVHAHNSWLETLLRLGLPGLLFALWFTVLTLKYSFQLMFFRKSTALQRQVSVTMCCILLSEFFEPGLFYTEVPTNYMSMAFLFFLGYLVCWAEEAEPIAARKQKTV